MCHSDGWVVVPMSRCVTGALSLFFPTGFGICGDKQRGVDRRVQAVAVIIARFTGLKHNHDHFFLFYFACCESILHQLYTLSTSQVHPVFQSSHSPSLETPADTENIVIREIQTWT